MKRVLCPKHEEKTPSCVVYDTHYYCFGCGARGELAELGMAGELSEASQRSRKVLNEQAQKKIKSDLETINSYPTSSYRGVNLPFDNSFYYLVWPNEAYYKKRRAGDSGPKYVCPKGARKPIYHIDRGSKTLVIVEGELNALSLSLVTKDVDICSPGGSAEFDKRYLTTYRKYDRFIIVADKDKAGAMAIITLKPILTKLSPHVDWYLVEQDFNETLDYNGKEVLRQRANKMGMSRRM